MEDDYADRERLAIYLEIEWSDFLYGQASSISSPPSPTHDIVPPVYFVALSKLIAESSSAFDAKRPRRYLEVGGGTGRLLFEIAQRLGSIEEYVFIEPSTRFFCWAQHFLTSDKVLPLFPPINSDQDREVFCRPPAIDGLKQRLMMHNRFLEDIDSKLGGFDLAVCSNVIDRHQQPRQFTERLKQLINPGGLIVLASPLDFLDGVTPIENRIDSLNDLFDSETWIDVAEVELPYSWRKWSRPRTWVGFSSQVVVKRRAL